MRPIKQLCGGCLMGFLATLQVTAQAQTAPGGEVQAFFVTGRVLQVLDSGILLEGSVLPESEHRRMLSLSRQIEVLDQHEREVARQRDELIRQMNSRASKSSSSSGDQLDQKTELLSLNRDLREALTKQLPKPTEGLFLILGIERTLADSEPWEGLVYSAGVYQYTSVFNSRKTVRRFAVSRQQAASSLRK